MIPNIEKDLYKLYGDICDIYRYSAQSSKDNPFIEWTESLIKASIPCGYSKGAQSVNEGDVNQKVENPKLFLPPGTDIKEGDKILIYNDFYVEPIEFKAGNLFPYPGSHIEVELRGKDYE